MILADDIGGRFMSVSEVVDRLYSGRCSFLFSGVDGRC
jgi:hypothetical protein